MAAYRGCLEIADQRTGEIHDYTRKRDHEWGEVIGSNGQQFDRVSFWNDLEKHHKRGDATLGYETAIALPKELNAEQRKALVHEFATAVAEKYSVAVGVDIHKPHKVTDRDLEKNPKQHWVIDAETGIRHNENWHFHVMVSACRVGENGELGKKVEALDPIHCKRRGIECSAEYIRPLWEQMANRALEQAGHGQRIDHRTYEAQGIDLTPTSHIGVHAKALAMQGIPSARMELFDQERRQQAEQINARPELILDKITTMQAVFDRRDIARELHRHIDDPEQFQRLFAKLEISPRLVELEPENGRNPARYSTQEMIDVERSMVERAERLAGTGRHGVNAAHVDAAIERAGSLSEEQAEAVRHVTQAGSLAVVVGDAGTGKSFSMKVAREAWEAQGFNVRGAALAGKAADELQAGSGIQSRTIASLEFGWKEGRDPLTNRDVLVIDEAGMVGSRQLGRVLEAAEKAGAKVVLLGDDKQLAAIEAGAAFRGVVQQVGASEITEVRRQKEAWAREAGQQLARGSAEAGLRAYAERGHVQIHDTREAARGELAAAYVADRGRGSQIILAHSNADVQALNLAVRDARKEAGELTDAARFMTERGGREFAAGDRMVFLRNDRELGVKNGTLGTVERAQDGGLSVRLDNGEMREVDAGRYAAVDHGYAVTIHKAQGVTVDRAYVLATPGMDRSLAYVGMTRHREDATLFAGADDFTDRRAGRLVEHGAAPFEHKPENRGSYFATVENDKGERSTIWGVDLERAIAASGAKAGDRIGLEHAGSETVRLPDGQTAERNTWHVRTPAELAGARLAQVIGRERPKESTLDFAARRGLDGEGVMRRWIERGRAKLNGLAVRANQAMRAILDRAGRQVDQSHTLTKAEHEQHEHGRNGPGARAAGFDAAGPAAGSHARGATGAGRKPDIGRADELPPPAARGRLRNLSELGVVRFSEGSEMLLPRDVPGHVEHAGAQPDHALRRPAHELTPKPQQPRTVDPLAGFRAAVERAQEAGGFTLDVAQARLDVAQEYQAAGKDPRHHSAAIMQEGQQRAVAGVREQPQAEPHQVEQQRSAVEPAQPAISEQDRKRAEALAKVEVGKFKALATERKHGFAGMTDRSPTKWRALPDELRERIEQFNALPKDRQAAELERMQRATAERYARDPQEAARDRQQQREQERGRDGGRGY